VVEVAEKTTYIKLDRNILQWRWFKNSKVLHVFLWMLIKANIKEGHFEKDVVPRGSLVTSNAHIAEACGLTIDNVRTALANLEETGEITRKIRNRYQLITLVKYDNYQSDIIKSTGQIPTDPDVKSQSTAMSNPNNQRRKEGKKERRKEEDGVFFDSPVGRVKRGTDAFRNQSHLLLKPEEGTVDDIPVRYRELCNNDFAVYWRYRHQ
jgi:hypothetical protein